MFQETFLIVEQYVSVVEALKFKGDTVTIAENTPQEPVKLIAAAKGTKLRAAGIALTTVALFLPAASSSAMGMTYNSTTMQIAWWSFLPPVVAALALVSPGIPAIRPYGKLLDIAAALFGVLVLGYIAYAIMDALSQASQTTAMMGSMASSLGMSLNPGVGLFGFAIGAAMLAFQAFRPSSAGGR